MAEEKDYIEKQLVGITHEGRPIYALEFKKPAMGDGTGPPPPKPVIYVDALIHCREWITTATMIKVFQDMLTASVTPNDENQWMINDIDWLFIPMINVDGYEETHNGDRLWRKTKSSGPSSQCLGTDANRNWNDNWSFSGTSTNPCSDVFHGPTPESESEVRHLANYILGNNPIDGVISVHSYSQLILYPYSYDFVLPENNAQLNETARNMHNAIKATHGKFYEYGPGASTIYPCSGVTSDWTYNKAGIKLSYTFELRDEGEYGFLLPEENIIPNAEEMFAAMVEFARYIKDSTGEGGEGEEEEGI